MVKRIAIIGGGIAGLTAGIYAQKHGYSAAIFEQHSLPGGVCTAWRREGFLVDGCIHWLMGCGKGAVLRQIYEELGVFEGVTIRPIDHYVRYHFADPTVAGGSMQVFDFTRDLDKLERDWLALSPEDRPKIKELVRGIRAFQSFSVDWSLGRPGASLWNRLKFLWLIRRHLRYFWKFMISIKEYVKSIKNPFLRWQLLNAFTDELPVCFLMMVLGDLTAGALGEVEEGSLRFALAIEKRFKSLGGEIHYKAPVRRILVQDGQGGNATAVGVELENGERHSFDHVISAADQFETVFKLLDGKFGAEETRKRFETWPLFEPILLVSFGVNRRFAPDEVSHHRLLLKRPISCGGAAQEDLGVCVFLNRPGFAPEGKTVVQAMVHTKYDFWERLSRDRPAYDAEKKRVASEVLAAMETLFPGISGEVEMTDVATPCTFVYYTRNYRGAWEGWSISAENFTKSVPKQLPGLANFWMAGQWVEPGGGIPGVVVSGRSVIDLISKSKGNHA